MLPGRRYLIKLGATTVGATVDHPKYQVNVNTLEHMAAKTLELNQIGVANLYLDRPIPFDPYVENRDMGGFILIDRMTNNTVGAGLIHFALRRADNVHWQAIEVDNAGPRLAQGPATRPWSGSPGSPAPGKSTIANIVERKLHAAGPPHLPARRRQPAPRAQPGPRVHHGRPGGERPAHGRGGRAHGRRRAHRAGLAHLALPGRAAHGP